jgi:acyl-[acyl carrier protein]--UDP-N-acetylglucosamine O-acyltransferase
MCGLNTVALRRSGLSSAERLQLKKLYHRLFRSREKLADSLAAARREFTNPATKLLIDFVASSTRGVCRDISMLGRSPEKIEDEDID